MPTSTHTSTFRVGSTTSQRAAGESRKNRSLRGMFSMPGVCVASRSIQRAMPPMKRESATMSAGAKNHAASDRSTQRSGSPAAL